MKLVHAAAVALVLAGTASLVAQAGPRRDGNWEVTIEIAMPNMPAGMTMPPMKTTQCITKEDAADPQKAMVSPGGRGTAPGDCKVTNYKTVGNTVSWDMACSGAQPVSGHAEFTYTADTYNGTMTANMARGGQPMDMNMKYSGKRLGDCVK
jgi:hypothetical protein